MDTTVEIIKIVNEREDVIRILKDSRSMKNFSFIINNRSEVLVFVVQVRGDGPWL